jgi:hypothetical protein
MTISRQANAAAAALKIRRARANKRAPSLQGYRRAGLAAYGLLQPN